MANAVGIVQPKEGDLMTMIRQRLSPEQQLELDQMGEEAKADLLEFAEDGPDGVNWVVQHWGLLKAQADYLKDF